MSTTVRYKKYELKSGNHTVLDTDFSKDIELEETHLAQIIRDFAHVTGLPSKPYGYKSYIEIQTSDDVIRIDRDYKSQTAQIISDKQQDPNFFWLPDEIAENAPQDRNPYVIFPMSVENMAKDLMQMVPKIKVAGNSLDPVTLQAKVDKYGRETLEKLIEIKDEIKEVEEMIENQRQVDEAQLSIGELEKQEKEIAATLNEVNELVQAQKDVYEKLKQHSKVLGENVLQRAEKLKEEMESIRLQKIKYEAELLEESAFEPAQKIAEGNKPKFARYLLALPVILAIISIAGYVFTSNLGVLALGILGGILEALLYLAINAVEPEVEVSKENIKTVTKRVEEVKIKSGLNIDKQRIKLIKDFFINKAWSESLRGEFEELKNAINSRLNDKNLGEVQLAKKEVETKLNAMKQIIDAHEGKDIPPDEYLKLRRKRELLRVEKSKVETELSQNGDATELDSLIADLLLLQQIDKLQTSGGGTDIPGSFVGLVSTRYLGIRIAKDQKQELPEVEDFDADNDKDEDENEEDQEQTEEKNEDVEDKADAPKQEPKKVLEMLDANTMEWTSNDFDRVELLGIYTYAKILQSQQKPGMPMVLVDVLSKLKPKALNTISSLLSELAAEIQVVKVSKKAN